MNHHVGQKSYVRSPPQGCEARFISKVSGRFILALLLLLSSTRRSVKIMDNSTGITKKYSSPAGPATKVGLAKAKSELGASQAHENIFLNLRSRFIQRLMKHGKKAVAVKLFDESLEIFYQKVQNLDSEELNRKTKRKKSSIE